MSEFNKGEVNEHKPVKYEGVYEGEYKSEFDRLFEEGAFDEFNNVEFAGAFVPSEDGINKRDLRKGEIWIGFRYDELDKGDNDNDNNDNDGSYGYIQPESGDIMKGEELTLFFNAK